MPYKDPEKKRACALRSYYKNREKNHAKVRERENQAYADDPEKGRQKARRFRDKNPARVQQIQNKYRDKKKEEQLLTEQQWREKHPYILPLTLMIVLLQEQLAQQKRHIYLQTWGIQYRAERKRVRAAMDPQKLAPILIAERAYQRLYQQGRRARVRALPWTFSADDARFMFEYWGYACAVCGNQEGFEWTLALDHWIAIKSPGCPGTVATNMLPLCQGQGGCNNLKWKHDGPTWLRERYGLRKAKRILKAIEAYFAVMRERSTSQSSTLAPHPIAKQMSLLG